MIDAALVVGVEKVTDIVGPRSDALVSQMVDYDFEAVNGITPAAQAGLVMQRYMYEYGVPRSVFADFSLLAHANGANNPNAMYRKAIRREMYENAPMVSDPLNLMDMAPYADGAAAALLTRADLLPGDFPLPLVRVSGSSVVTDRLSLHDRERLLDFDAAGISVNRACSQAGILPGEVDLFELWDGFSIYAALSLEAACFAPRGEGWRMAQNGDLSIHGRLPALTMGGQKARSNPLGAAGMYQIVEATQQLRGQAGNNQVQGARRALVQALGGAAATAVAHVLERM
jgi:acetyl-CoA C-acetyltransferase